MKVVSFFPQNGPAPPRSPSLGVSFFPDEQRRGPLSLYGVIPLPLAPPRAGVLPFYPRMGRPKRRPLDSSLSFLPPGSLSVAHLFRSERALSIRRLKRLPRAGRPPLFFLCSVVRNPPHRHPSRPRGSAAPCAACSIRKASPPFDPPPLLCFRVAGLLLRIVFLKDLSRRLLLSDPACSSPLSQSSPLFLSGITPFRGWRCPCLDPFASLRSARTCLSRELCSSPRLVTLSNSSFLDHQPSHVPSPFYLIPSRASSLSSALGESPFFDVRIHFGRSLRLWIGPCF